MRKAEQQEPAPDEVVRGFALFCAAIVSATQGGDGLRTLERAKRFEEYIRGEPTE